MVRRARDLLLVCWALCASAALAQSALPACEGADACAEPALAGSAPAHEARRAFERGLTALRAERWSEAEAELRTSLYLMPRASSTYNLAFVLFKQGRSRESLDLLRELLDAAAGAHDGEYLRYAEELLPRVLAELARVRLRLEPASAQLRVDGALVAGTGAERALALDPGSHQFEVSAPRFATARLALALEAGALVTREIVLSPPSPHARATPAASEARPRARSERAGRRMNVAGPWTLIGVGAALLVGSIVTGSLAKRADDAFVARCPSLKDCAPALQERREQALRLARTTDALVGSGLTLVAGGATWRLLAPRLSLRPAERSWLVTAGARF